MKKTAFLFGIALGAVAITTGAFAINGNFPDLTAEHWAYKAVTEQTTKGLWEGIDGEFQPNKPMTRAEMAAFIQRNNEMLKQEMMEMMEQDNYQTTAMFTAENGWFFYYPAIWSISSMNGLSQNAGMVSFMEENFGKINDIQSLDVLYKKTQDNSEMADLQVIDLVFEKTPGSNSLYLQTLINDWPDMGNIDSYTSINGLEFGVWSGDGPAFEGKYMVYVTQYTDQQGQKHWVQLSAIGNDLLAIEKNLKPVVDSLKLPVATTESLNYKNNEYGFTLEFPESWEGYDVFSSKVDVGESGITDSVVFGFDTQNDLFMITVYSKDQWLQLQETEDPKPLYLDENSEYVFSYTAGQYAASEEMEMRIAEIMDIVDSFNLLSE